MSAVGLRPILTTGLGQRMDFRRESEKSEKQSRGNRPGFWCNLILLSCFLHPSLVPSILEGTNCNGVSCSSGYFSRECWARDGDTAWNGACLGGEELRGSPGSDLG